MDKDVLFIEMSSIERYPDREIPLHIYIRIVYEVCGVLCETSILFTTLDSQIPQ